VTPEYEQKRLKLYEDQSHRHPGHDQDDQTERKGPGSDPEGSTGNDETESKRSNSGRSDEGVGHQDGQAFWFSRGEVGVGGMEAEVEDDDTKGGNGHG
jgi:hypothetical protein